MPKPKVNAHGHFPIFHELDILHFLSKLKNVVSFIVEPSTYSLTYMMYHTRGLVAGLSISLFFS